MFFAPIPFIPDPHLEAEAERLLLDYGSSFSPVVAPPVPVEDILEKHLGLRLSMDDLKTIHGDPLILGAINFRGGVVHVDSSLDPDADPTQLGRYHYTLGHELGHWCIHRKYLLTEARQLDCIGDENRPDIICRDGDKKDPKETQAERFSALLLMPKRLMFETYRNLFISDATHGDNQFMFTEVVVIMAERFSVSKTAMGIRLGALNLLRPKDQLPLI